MRTKLLSSLAVVASLLLLAIGGSRGATTPPPSPPVYVSGGSTIYQLNGGSLVPILKIGGANFESLAIGPDNVDLDLNGNPLYPSPESASGPMRPGYLLYACDTAKNRIIRFDTGASSIDPQIVYDGKKVTSGPNIEPVCGRFTSTGDLYVTDELGGGIYKITPPASEGPDLADVTFSPSASIGASAVSVNADSALNRGITQKYQGDMLAVDSADNEVLRLAYPGFTTVSSSSPNPFISSGNISAPVGIARASTGEVFVSNSGSNAPQVAHFGPTGGPPSSCSSLTFQGNQTPVYLATAAVASPNESVVTDTLYLVSTSSNAGTLWTWNSYTSQGSCSLTAAATVKAGLSGVAVAPTPVTLSLPVNALSSTRFNFNSNLFDLVTTGSECEATVTAYPMSPGTVRSMILHDPSTTDLPNGALPAVNLGEQGYEIVYVAHWVNPNSSCVWSSDQFAVSVAGFADPNSFDNPRVIQCEDDPSSNEPTLFPTDPTCQVPQTLGVYPEGGPIADDFYVHSNSVFAVVNANPSTLAGTSSQAAGQFCGFESPLLTDITQDQAPIFTLGSRNTIPVKFKLAAASGTCQNGPYISGATALISVAQLAPSFQAIDVNPTASSLILPPLFNADNNQYQFTLDISTYAPGTYIITVTFLTSNTINQSTYFKIQ